MIFAWDVGMYFGRSTTWNDWVIVAILLPAPSALHNVLDLKLLTR